MLFLWELIFVLLSKLVRNWDSVVLNLDLLILINNVEVLIIFRVFWIIGLDR